MPKIIVPEIIVPKIISDDSHIDEKEDSSNLWLLLTLAFFTPLCLICLSILSCKLYRKCHKGKPAAMVENADVNPEY